MKLYQRLAQLVTARMNCLKPNRFSGESAEEWAKKHEAAIKDLVKNLMPSGSGIDNGTEIDLEKSNGEKLTFLMGYHHMDENGYYDGWTNHTVTVTASLEHDFNVRVSGKDRNQIKDYIADMYRECLIQEVKIY